MPKDNLGNKSRKGFVWDLSGTFLRQLSTLVISIVLARLLTPEQFGIIGMALVFIAISQVFIDVGFTDGLIQSKEVSDVMYSSIFFINLGISLVIATLIFLVAPLIGSFYGNQQVSDVIKWLSLVLPLAALGKVHAAILTRNIDFKALAVRDMLSTFFAGIIGISLALLDYGVYALVVQQIILAGVGTLLLWYGTRWKPQFVFSWSNVQSLFSFSSYVFFEHLIRRIFQKVDTLFIGKVFSPAILGFYTRAESLRAQVQSYTNASLRKVIYPVFSAIQDDDERFEVVYYKAMGIAAVGSATLVGLLFFLADKIILLLLGSQWIPSIILFQILIFEVILAPFGSLTSKAMLSKGYSKIKFKVGLLGRCIKLLPMIFGLFYGIKVFAVAVVCSAAIVVMINLVVVYYYLHISFLKQTVMIVKPSLPLLVVMGSYYLLFPNLNSFLITAIFILTQWVYLIATKDEGYYNLVQEYHNSKVKLKSAFNFL